MNKTLALKQYHNHQISSDLNEIYIVDKIKHLDNP